MDEIVAAEIRVKAKMQIEGCTALVTGANRGLGRAFAEALRQAGAAKVYAGARDPATITDPRLVPVRLYVTSPCVVEAAARACGDVDVLINNAGALQRSAALAKDAEAALRLEMEVNVFGLRRMMEAFAPILGRNGGGAIANMLSVVSWYVFPFNATYCATKHAAMALTDGARMQLMAQGTSVTGVYAGFIDTDMAAGVAAEKTSPRQVAERTLDGVRAGQDHVFADERAEEIWRLTRTDPTRLSRQSQEMWDAGASIFQAS